MPELKDCDWVVERCKQHLSRDDRHNAKAWILTARSLFPDNFAVQYEAFQLHICCGEFKEAAKALADLFTKFPSEQQMKVYLLDVVAQVVAKHKGGGGEGEVVAKHKGGGGEGAVGGDRKTKQDLFQLLPPLMQKAILLQASEHVEASDVLKRCRILQTAFALFPDSAITLGLDLYDVLNQQPSGSFSTAADNPYKELLVGEVIPRLTESSLVCIEHPLTRTNGQTVVLKTSHLCQWLEAAASYYTAITAQALTRNRAHSSAGRTSWEKLHRLFMATAEKCGWREIMLSKTIGPHLPAKVRWMGLEKIAGYNTHIQASFEAPRPVAIACFYIAVFLFFEMAWEYCCEMLYPSGGGEKSSSGERPPWILVEDRLIKTQVDEKSTKRRKVEEQYQAFLNIQTGSRSLDQKMVECFVVATDCWSFLQSNVTYSRELSRLCQQWGAWDWRWLNSFRADMHLFKGDHNMAIQVLQHEWHKMKAEDKARPDSLRFIAQLVNCSAFVGDVKASCNFASEMIGLLPDTITRRKAHSLAPPPSVPPPASKPTTTRQLRLLKCTVEEILPFCIQGIIRTLKDVAFSDPKNERALGQLLVLLQYNWPAEEAVFASVITTIQKRRKFHCPDFFKYIITTDILEEMMFLSNCDGLNIILLPQSVGTKTRTVTRGVNRGAREGLMAAMEKQLLRCEESIESVLQDFFKNEKLSLGSDA